MIAAVDIMVSGKFKSVANLILRASSAKPGPRWDEMRHETQPVKHNTVPSLRSPHFTPMSLLHTRLRCLEALKSGVTRVAFASTSSQAQEGVPAVQTDLQLRLSAIKLYKEVSW